MNRHVLIPVLSCILPWLGACSLSSFSPRKLVPGFVGNLVGMGAAYPTSNWNPLGIWQQVSDNPATYIPKGYPLSAPLNEDTGTWFADKRGGKRLFVPNTKVGNLEPGVLMGEARKVTGSPAVMSKSQTHLR